MKHGYLKRFMLFTAVFSMVFAVQSLSAQTRPDIQKAKKAAEAKGYIFAASRDEIVANAKKEGALRVLSSLDPDTLKPMAAAFKKKYPFINATIEEITGTDASQRLLLELKAGVARGTDVTHASEDFYTDFAEHAKKFDIHGMAEAGVLNMNPKMVDPKFLNVVSLATGASAVAYNKNLIDPAKVPDTWADFLKPEFKGKKFAADIRPHGMAVLIAGMGEEWGLDYARKIKEQDPVWTRGHSRTLTAMIAGEYALHQQTNYHSCVRAARADRTNALVCKVVEPLPLRLQEHELILKTASNPYAALLWLEFATSDEGQKLIDEFEPAKSSIHYEAGEIARIAKGRKIILSDAVSHHKTPEWMEKVVAAYGFPQAERDKKKKKK